MENLPAFCLRANSVFDVPGATVVRVVAGVIHSVGNDQIIEPGDAVVRFDTGTVLPGLIDAHVHLGPGSARLGALHGVTTLIDQFSTPALIADERARVRGAAGSVACADLRVASVGATAPGGHPSMAYAPIPYVTGPEDAAPFVDARVAEGATHLKIVYDDGLGAAMHLHTMSAESIRALVVAAHGYGLVTVGHVSTAVGAAMMAECGVDVLGHVPFEALSADQVDAVAAAGMAAIATLSVVDGFSEVDGRLPLEVDLVLAPRLTPPWGQALRAQAQRWMPPGRLDINVARENVSRLHARGVPILAGTDAPNPGLATGVSLHRELRQLTRAGLSNAEAIAAATSVPAGVFRLGDRGRIASGMRADLLVVDGDPCLDIMSSGRVLNTWVAGLKVQPSPMDAEAETAQLAWMRVTNERILAAVRELWPQWAARPQPEVIHLTGNPMVDEHLPGLTHPEKDIRQKAAVQLGTLADRALAAAFAARLRDESDFFVRETLTWAAVRVSTAVLPLIEELAGSPDAADRLQALHVLSKIAAPSSIPTVSQHTGDGDSVVAAKARSAMARIGTSAALPFLVRHLGEGSAEARGQLATEIAALGGHCSASGHGGPGEPLGRSPLTGRRCLVLHRAPRGERGAGARSSARG